MRNPRQFCQEGYLCFLSDWQDYFARSHDYIAAGLFHATLVRENPVSTVEARAAAQGLHYIVPACLHGAHDGGNCLDDSKS